MSDSGKKKKGKKPRLSDIRGTGRSWGLSILYGMEYVHDGDVLVSRFGELMPRATEFEEAMEFANEVVSGVIEHQEEIDERIQASSPRWKVHRMSVIDRNILRLASWELFYRPDVPPRVVINEAVELAKRYGAEQTRSFVNGILQQICIDNEISLQG